MRDKELANIIIPIFTLPSEPLLIVGHNPWIWDCPLLLTSAGPPTHTECAELRVFLLQLRLFSTPRYLNVYHSQRVHDVIRALELHGVDGFNFNGGLVGFQQLDRIAWAAGLPLLAWFGD